VRALEAGKHVFCEKPLALTVDDLDRVTQAWRASKGHLLVGFNRRWSAPVTLVRDHFAGGSGPLVLNYRVNAGKLGPKHWYADRRQGGRLLGEVCHFIDTCAAVVGEPAESVFCVGAGRGEALLEEDLVVTLRYPGCSVATITYSSGGFPGTPKERLEVLGRGHTAVIDDFRRTVLDEQVSKAPGQDKGHAAALTAFRSMIGSRTGNGEETLNALSSSAAAVAAVASLLSGTVAHPRLAEQSLRRLDEHHEAAARQ